MHKLVLATALAVSIAGNARADHSLEGVHFTEAFNSRYQLPPPGWIPDYRLAVTPYDVEEAGGNIRKGVFAVYQHRFPEFSLWYRAHFGDLSDDGLFFDQTQQAFRTLSASLRHRRGVRISDVARIHGRLTGGSTLASRTFRSLAAQRRTIAKLASAKSSSRKDAHLAARDLLEYFIDEQPLLEHSSVSDINLRVALIVQAAIVHYHHPQPVRLADCLTDAGLKSIFEPTSKFQCPTELTHIDFTVDSNDVPYPFVFMHGMMGDPNYGGLFTYWADFHRIEAKHPEFQMFYTDSNMNGHSIERGAELYAQIQEILNATGARKVHLIGHSQGGLDARLLVHLGMATDIASITTIGTPHRGIEPYTATIGRMFGSMQFGIKYMQDIFNPSYPGIARIPVFSYVGTKPRLSSSAFVGLADGVVRVESQRWGTVLGDLDATHTQEIWGSEDFDHLAFYTAHMEFLRRQENHFGIPTKFNDIVILSEAKTPN